MSIRMGVGTRYLGFSFRRPDGTHDATKWFVLLYMPIVPLRRHTLLVGETSGHYAAGAVSYVTRYVIRRDARPRPLEVLATYLTWWVAVPGIAVAPLVLLNASDAEAADEFFPVLLAIGWLLAVPVGVSKIAARVRRLPS